MNLTRDFFTKRICRFIVGETTLWSNEGYGECVVNIRRPLCGLGIGTVDILSRDRDEYVVILI